MINDQLQSLLAPQYEQLVDVLTQLLAVREAMDTDIVAGRNTGVADRSSEQVLLARRDLILAKIELIKAQVASNE